jgi:hypothetical protein
MTQKTVRTCIENEAKENREEGFEHESKRKLPRSSWEQQVRKYVTQKERKKEDRK